MTDSNQHSEHIAAMREWAFAEKASPYAEWRIDRAQARYLFEQLQAVQKHRDQLADMAREQEDENRRLLEQFETLREAAAGVVDVGTRKGMLFSTDPETRSDSLVGFYVAAHPFIALQKALAGSNPASTRHGRDCGCTPCKAEDWDSVEAGIRGWIEDKQMRRHP